MAELRRSFRPEFLNRLDETILFHPLTKENLDGIIDIMVSSLRKRIEDRGLSLAITDAAKSLIIDRGFDPLYGARPLRRTIRAQVEDKAAELLLTGALVKGSTAVVDGDGDTLTVTPEQAVPAVADHSSEPQTQQRSF